MIKYLKAKESIYIKKIDKLIKKNNKHEEMIRRNMIEITAIRDVLKDILNKRIEEESKNETKSRK